VSKEFVDNHRCFVCGGKNREGLRLEFRLDREGGGAEATVIFPERFQGWECVVHGGLLATVLDEAMVKAAWARDMRSVTGEITVRYIKPAKVETPYRLVGRLTGSRGKIVLAESELLGEGGEAVARASGKLFKLMPKGKS
jgi:acyl-coenzyme A thioesterase PaaI-like protein